MKTRNMMGALVGYMGIIYDSIFHKRNIIIVSERKVKHIPISGPFQLVVTVACISAVCWASYSTGSYYAAHNALKEQSLTLKSVIGNKVDSSFAVLGNSGSENDLAPLANSKAALSSIGNIELLARIAELESRLHESEESKLEFMRTVEQKTAKNIDSFEKLIEQTGLDVDVLKNQAEAKLSKDKDGGYNGQGGPYISDNMLDMKAQEEDLISKLDELSALKNVVSTLPLGKPMGKHRRTSRYGHRIDPFTGRLALHSGVDMAGPIGAKIYATADGVVTQAERRGAYGKLIDIDHGFNVSSRYAHLGKILVQPGDRITKGQLIAIQGSTGRSTGAHLHYEVRYKNKPMDPNNFLSAGRYVQ